MLHEQPHQSATPSGEVDELSTPPWTENAKEAVKRLAFGLEEGFIRELRFFVATNQIGIVSSADGGKETFSKCDLSPDVFTQVLHRFVKETTPEGSSQLRRRGEVSYKHPDDSVHSIHLASRFFSPEQKGAEKTDWPIVSVVLVNQSMITDSATEQAQQVQTYPIRGSSHLIALKFQVEDQLMSQQAFVSLTDSVDIQDHDSEPRVQVLSIANERWCRRAMGLLQQRLHGVTFRAFSYQEEGDVTGQELWGIDIIPEPK